MTELFEVHPDTWLAECELTDEYYDKFGDRVPAGLHQELSDLVARLKEAKNDA